MSVRLIVAALCWLLFETVATGQTETSRALIEVKIGTTQFLGRVAAADEKDCWLFQRDGRMTKFLMDDVTDCGEIEARFKPFTSLELRDRLQTEFGRNFEVKTTQHYVVAARPGTAERHAALFESLYRQCHRYFVSRGFRMAEPEFPLIAIVFPDQSSFSKYCRSEGRTPPPGLVGFYLATNNRVALFERSASESDMDDTLIHEATHQVAFNTGIHSRIGQNPLWVVEGLATLFEAEGIRIRQPSDDARQRINPERLKWFNNYQQQRRKAGSLETFLRDDTLFRRAPLDAYSQAWGLTFYLVESRPAEFSRYLKAISARDPMTSYDSDSRLRDFQDAFGKDLEFVETGMLRFLDQLNDAN